MSVISAIEANTAGDWKPVRVDESRRRTIGNLGEDRIPVLTVPRELLVGILNSGRDGHLNTELQTAQGDKRD